MAVDAQAAKAAFAARFGRAPEFVVRAPGRVNIIGEHTDYNHGFVMPMALERDTMFLATRRGDLRVNAHAANLERSVQADLRERTRNPREPWIDYVVGVADELVKLGKPLAGVDLMIVGDVPVASGLSSSASLEMAALTLFEALGGFELAGAEAARLGQRVENQFLGLSTGIMDQFISRLGKAGHALFLDCRSLQYDLIPVAFTEATFVIANTCVPRGLTSSKYNERVGECAEAVRAMNGKLGRPGTHLRDFTLDDLEACREAMPETVFRRARHVVTEDRRTLRACDAMRAGDASALGALMTASDLSLRDDYAVTCAELDAMTEIARGLPGCFGARMTGAGFGGCTIHLVASGAVEPFGERLLEEYGKRAGLRGELIVSAPGEGACRLE